MARRSFLSAMLGDREHPHVLYNERSGRIVASHVELAVDSRSRRRGLLGRDSLADGAALVIAPCSSIHTFFMRFPIDAIFVARDGRVLKTYVALVRSRIGFSVGAFAVVELPVNTIVRSDAKRGDMLRLSREDARE